MQIADSDAARLYQEMTKSVDWMAITPEAEIPVLEDIITHLGTFPMYMPIFYYPYAVPENRYTTVSDRIKMLSKRLGGRKRIVSQQH